MGTGLKPKFLPVTDHVIRAVQVNFINSLQNKNGACNWTWVDFSRGNNVALANAGLSVLKIINQETVSLLVLKHNAVSGAQDPIWRVSPWYALIAALHLGKALAESTCCLFCCVVALPEGLSAERRLT